MDLLQSCIGNVVDHVGLAQSDVGLFHYHIGTIQSHMGKLQPDIGLFQSDMGMLRSDVGLACPDTRNWRDGVMTDSAARCPYQPMVCQRHNPSLFEIKSGGERAAVQTLRAM
jgi:hypothetical protein